MDESNERPFTFGSAMVWTIIALFLDLFFIGMSESSRAGASYDLVSRTACQAIAYSIALFGILRIHEPETSIRHILGLRAPSPVAIVLALALGAALSLPSSFLDNLLDARFPRPAEETEALERILTVSTLGKRIALVVTLAVIQPALDELFFRGALFTPLRRTRTVETVIVASAALETLGTLNPRAMVTLLVATLVFAWLRAATGSIWPSIVARRAYFGVEVVPIALGRAAPKPTHLLVLASGGIAVLSLLGIAWLARRRATMAAAATVGPPPAS